MVTVEVILCNRPLGTKASPTLYGTCEKVSGHSGSCTSPELKAYRRTHTAASRAKHAGDEFFCNHTLCKKGCPFYGIPYPSRTELAAREQREREEAAQEAQRVAASIRKAEEERFIGEILAKAEAGEAVDYETQELFRVTCASYLGVESGKFRLDRDSRIKRGLDIEERLSDVLFGPSYTRLGEPPCRLDENSFKVKLGRFLNVADHHGWLNVAHRYHPSHPSRVPNAPTIPISTGPAPHVIGGA